jgi:predicted dehydrogenase
MANNKLRAVVCGCGGISRAWIGPLGARGDVEVAGLVDLREESARRLAAESGLREAVVGTDFEGVLDQTRPDIVFDCTVPEAHAAVTLTALARGCHVFGEKPLADTMENAACMVAAARKAGRIYAVMQNRRYDPNVRALRRFVESGAIGPVTTVHCDFFIGAHFGGFRDRMRHVLLLDMAIHTFDAARLISGADPVSALCHEWNPPGSWYDHDASAVAVFEMTRAVVYSYRGSWCAEGRGTTWESSWRVIGEKGSVTWDGAREFRAQAVTGGTGFSQELKEAAVPLPDADGGLRGHAGAIDEFLRCVREGGAPETVGDDNIKSLAMVHAAVASAQEGRRVRIAELPGMGG